MTCVRCSHDCSTNNTQYMNKLSEKAKSALYEAVYSILQGQGFPVEPRGMQYILTLDSREYIVKSPVVKTQITLEDTIQESYSSAKRLRVRPGLRLEDKRKV